MIKAQVTQVPVGPLSIKGLMSDKGEFGIAIPQTAALFSVNQNVASRDFKRLLGKASPSSKIRKDVLQWNSELNSKPVNVLSLQQFQYIVTTLAFQGNEKAKDLVLSLVGLSLHQLFCDAFGVKMGAEERQQFLLGELKALEKEKEYYQTGMIKANMRASKTRRAAAEKRAMVRAFEGYENSRGANKARFREEFYKLAEGKGEVDYRNLDELAPVEVPPLLRF